MHHFAELIAILEKAYPEDEWFRQRDAWGDEFTNCFPQFGVYDAAIQLVDEQSWRVLTEKVRGSFRQPLKQRGKHQFFDNLNEVLAYEFLKKYKCVTPELLSELMSNNRPEAPDLAFEYGGSQFCCEVKTINVSDEEVGRWIEGQSFDSDVYLRLNSDFFTNKLKNVINKAKRQIGAFSSGKGLIYLVIHFDDFSHMFYKAYKLQITEFLEINYPDTAIIMRIGVDVPKYITHQENLIFKPAQS